MDVVGAFSGYTSNDISSCKQFYIDTLGLNVMEVMGGLRLTIDGQQVSISPKHDHQPASFTVLNLVVKNIDAAVDELTEKGIRFERYDNLPAAQDARGVLRGKDVGMGPNIAWFKDPSNNILALVEE